MSFPDPSKQSTPQTPPSEETSANLSAPSSSAFPSLWSVKEEPPILASSLLLRTERKCRWGCETWANSINRHPLGTEEGFSSGPTKAITSAHAGSIPPCHRAGRSYKHGPVLGALGDSAGHPREHTLGHDRPCTSTHWASGRHTSTSVRWGLGLCTGHPYECAPGFRSPHWAPVQANAGHQYKEMPGPWATAPGSRKSATGARTSHRAPSRAHTGG